MLLDQNSLIFDIGANVGVYSLFGAINSKAKVYSFEPINYLFKSQKYLFKNSNVKNFNCALGSKKQRRKFYIPINNDPESSLIKKKTILILSTRIPPIL